MEKVPRPFRVCLTGAESTGKSELAARLARQFSAPVVPEYSREYAQRAARALNFMDVAPIARGQMALEERLAGPGSSLLILDTDVLSTVVYSRHHYRSCPGWIVEAAKKKKADLYLLLDIDVPWIADAVRDSGDTRAELQALFRRTLEEFEAAYQLVSGSWDQRFRSAVKAVSEWRLQPGMT